jgi:hypothetical protein
MSVTNTTVEEVIKIILSNPGTVVEAIMIAALQFIVGVVFGYFAVRR